MSLVLSDIEPFHASGTPSDEYIVVESLEEALEHVDSSSWQDFAESAQGDLTAWLSVNHPLEYQGKWNNYVKEIKPRVESFVFDRIANYISLPLSPSHVSALKWDVLLVEMDLVYSKFKKRPINSKMIAEAWLNGRFPCGYDSDKKKLIVY